MDLPAVNLFADVSEVIHRLGEMCAQHPLVLVDFPPLGDLKCSGLSRERHVHRGCLKARNTFQEEDIPEKWASSMSRDTRIQLYAVSTRI